MIDTVINKELGIQYPIFQGGMAWVADASLASGVSNAGGLGIIAAMNSNGEQLRAEIKKCNSITTDTIYAGRPLILPVWASDAELPDLEKSL